MKKINEYAETKRIELAELEESQKTQERKDMFNKFEKIDQIQQVISIRLKDYNPDNHKLILECIELNEPIILGIWEVKELTNDMAEFVDNLKAYSDNVQSVHMKRVITKKLQEMNNS